MPYRDHHRRGYLQTMMLLGIVAGAPSLSAADDDDLEPPPPAPLVRSYTDKNFDQWVFGGNMNAVQFHERLEALLTRRVNEVDGDCKLTEPQKKKILLAGRGDQKRVLDFIDLKRQEFHTVMHDRQKVSRFVNDLQPLLQVSRKEFFGTGSLFTKTLKTTLTPKQTIEYEKAEKERWLVRHRLAIRSAVDAESRRLRLTSEQRNQFQSLLEESIQPVYNAIAYERSIQYHILISMGQLPEERVRSILTEDQWRVYSTRMSNLKSSLRVLEQQRGIPQGVPRVMNGR